MAPVLILARSARQLAVAARAAGQVALVADLFGDSDTREAASEFRRLPTRDGWQLDPDAVMAMCAAVADRRGALSVVWGSGFEDCPELLSRLAERFRVLGCSPRRVAEIADPSAFSSALARLGIAHPETRREAPEAPANWLCKRAGSAGGAHVTWAAQAAAAAGRYWQRHVAGTSLSATLLAGATGTALIGCCAHWWPERDPRWPFRQAGGVSGIHLPPAVYATLARYAQRLGQHFELRGLCGVDFILDAAGEVHVLELNPRPTASVELLVDPAAAFAAHVAACAGDARAARRGRRSHGGERATATVRAASAPRYAGDVDDQILPPVALGARAHAVCYAPDAIALPNSLDWPDWVADRPLAGARVPAHAPLCTVRAQAADAPRARALLAERMNALWRMLGVEQHGAIG